MVKIRRRISRKRYYNKACYEYERFFIEIQTRFHDTLKPFHACMQGYAEATVRTRLKLLKRLVRLGADIFDPESMKKVLAEEPWKSNSKFQAVIAYDNFAEMAGIRCMHAPNYRRVDNLPFVPTETEINQLIAGVATEACYIPPVAEGNWRQIQRGVPSGTGGHRPGASNIQH